MRELIVTTERQLHGNAKGLDRHNGNRAHGRADGEENQRIFLSMSRRNPVNHDRGEDGYSQTVQKKSCSSDKSSSRTLTEYK